MKKLILFLSVCFFSFNALQAQVAKQPLSPEQEKTAREATESLTTKYSLNADQAKTAYTIQVRKQRNLAAVMPLQESDPALYRTKMQNLQDGTLASIRRMLKTKEQVTLFEQTKATVRSQKAAKRKELLAQKASKEVIESALLAIYAE